ncbi:hypothetical protein jhhlp_001073 [Lomentospora prolificans]|uniref:DSC E3 ubiquitin ligase complex subunit 3 C-terminal domain-containing protein n=1 Tax=Lomentospora prolificans TaxID=41688 RepID=A0A2N3NH64_9PEZI|nr:hypothetical protein jhhlp_001073 [Lomentospora prolificans]
MMDPPPLLLTIRFSASHPDLPSTSPHHARSPPSNSSSAPPPRPLPRRLRFIHQGRILTPDSLSLSAALDPRGKGKAPLSERIFLNCSIGDVLSQHEIDEEARQAKLPPSDATGSSAGNPARQGGRAATHREQQQQPQGPRRRGFDRLLDAGFSAAEVNQLRLQFRSIHEARHTPDTMPGEDTLRDMEDAWIDDHGAGQAAEDAVGDDGAAGMGGNAIGDVLDVFLQGIVVGFFLPMASLSWLLREEGMWSKRRQVAVLFGVIVSVIIGLFKAISGDIE